VAGEAVERAAHDAREKIVQAAAALLESDPADLEIDGNSVCLKGARARSVPLSTLAALTYNKIGPILGYGTASMQRGHAPPGMVEGIVGAPHQDITFGAVACEVEIDSATGEVRPLRMVAAHDVGIAINPKLVEGQIEGAAIQGLGYALGEEQVMEDGMIRNTLLNDYLVPMTTTVPPVEAIVVEGYAPSGTVGGKGVGEHALLGVAPAVANAIQAAVGARVRQLPITPERVLEALREDTK
jgi:CO/xanthine dehydrogenase Mo-binding subunit